MKNVSNFCMFFQRKIEIEIESFDKKLFSFNTIKYFETTTVSSF
jgi:hypothetical protein